MIKAHDSLVVNEFSKVDLGDYRLHDGFRSIMLDLLCHYSKTAASNFDNYSKIKASHRLLYNPRVKEQAILAPNIAKTESRNSEHPVGLLLSRINKKIPKHRAMKRDHKRIGLYFICKKN